MEWFSYKGGCGGHGHHTVIMYLKEEPHDLGYR